MAHPSGWDIKYTFSLYDVSTYDIAKLGEVEAEILGRGKTHEAVPTEVVRASYNNNRLPCAVIFSEAPGRGLDRGEQSP